MYVYMYLLIKYEGNIIQTLLLVFNDDEAAVESSEVAEVAAEKCCVSVATSEDDVAVVDEVTIAVLMLLGATPPMPTLPMPLPGIPPTTDVLVPAVIDIHADEDEEYGDVLLEAYVEATVLGL